MQRCSTFSLFVHISQTKLEFPFIWHKISDAILLVLSTCKDNWPFWKQVCVQWHSLHVKPCFSETSFIYEIALIQLSQMASRQGSRYGLWASLSNPCLHCLQVVKSFSFFISARKSQTSTVHWSWPAMLGCSDSMGIGCVPMPGCSGSMGIGCVRFWPRISAIAWDTCCNCSLESNDVVVCAGATGSMGMGADWAWGLAATVPWWCLGCLLDLVVGWAGSRLFLFGMPNCSECKYKTKTRNRKMHQYARNYV